MWTLIKISIKLKKDKVINRYGRNTVEVKIIRTDRTKMDTIIMFTTNLTTGVK